MHITLDSSVLESNILSHLKTLPYYSTNTKDRVIEFYNATKSKSLEDSALFPVTEKRNNQIEETGNYFNGLCEAESTYRQSPPIETVYKNNKGKVQTILYATTSPHQKLISSYPFLRLDALPLVSDLSENQKELTQRNFVLFD